MSSAAVIGRQLRQQNTGVRNSGPLVPPAGPHKGRPRTPSHHQPGAGPGGGQRPYSPAASSVTGTGSDQRVNVNSGAQVYAHHYTSSQERDKHSKNKKDEEDEEPKLKCTWHCFCIALKALSGGIVLLLAGTIMSVVGFVAEAQLMNSMNSTMVNGTLYQPVMTNATSEAQTTFRNLTYAGPVIMGLGGIVIIAACVLTFEVRDTLGVKVAPVKSPPPMVVPTAVASTNVSLAMGEKRKSTIASISSTKASLSAAPGATTGSAEAGGKVAKGGKAPVPPLSLPLAVLSDLSNPGGAVGGVPLSSKALRHPQETIHETVLSESGASSASHAVAGASSSGSGLGGGVGSAKVSQSGSKSEFAMSKRAGGGGKYAALPPSASSGHEFTLTSPSSSRTTYSHDLLSPNIESLYFGLPSPQETECSDPDGCSLQAPARWRSSRCSCSGSPSHSLSIDLYLDEPHMGFGGDPSGHPMLSVKLLEQQRIQQQLIIQQQMLLEQQQQQLALQRRLLYEQQQRSHRPRRPKTIASVESDGLSDTSDDSDHDLFAQTAYQVHPRYQAAVREHHKAKSRTCFATTVNVHRPYDHGDVSTPLLRDVTTSNTSSSATTSTTVTNPSASVLPSSAASGALSNTVSRDRNGGGGAEAATATTSGPADKRFPLLLRPGTLGNGSVHKNSNS